HPAPAFASSNVGAGLILESCRMRRHSPTAPNLVRCYPPWNLVMELARRNLQPRMTRHGGNNTDMIAKVPEYSARCGRLISARAICSARANCDPIVDQSRIRVTSADASEHRLIDIG